MPAAIKTLLTAGIRVWMITGDKMETAVNIAVSCQLVKDPDSIMMLVVDEKQDGEGVGGGSCLGVVCREGMCPGRPTPRRRRSCRP